ncbi:MAG TPA: DUF2474 family protein [Sphingomonas sp.]|nr:DUF2474 family protein [Sphingomonas sp.]
MTGRPGIWARRIGWFAGLWAFSVAALAMVSLILKLIIGR